MEINSYDFWDTLVTRLVPKSIDIFFLVEEVTSIKGFAKRRVLAEEISREGIPETNIERIYSFLPYTALQKELLKRTELDLEQKLSSPICENISKLKECDLIISDTYLEDNVILKIARHNGIQLNKDNYHISSRIGRTKSEGSIYSYILEKHAINIHIGDNLLSDVKNAGRFRIKAQHYSESSINSYTESKIKKRFSYKESFYALGILRASRLNCPYISSADKALWEVFSQVVAPVLFNFVHTLLKDAKKKGIAKVFFLSRDGQILHQVALRINDLFQYGLSCKYIYASRQALHLPGFRNIEQAISWILDDTQFLSLETIAQRVHFTSYEILELATEYLTQPNLNKNLDCEERLQMQLCVRDKRFVDKLQIKSAAAFANASDYYKHAGLFEDKEIAIVDVGWTGKIQKSLENIILKYKADVSVSGYYFSLANNCVYDDPSRVFGYISSPFEMTKNKWIDRYRFVIELFLSADHPGVTGFELINAVPEPVFNHASVPNYILKVPLFHAAVLAYSDNAAKLLGLCRFDMEKSELFFINNLKAFLCTPPAHLAKHFKGFEMSEEQYTTTSSLLIRNVTFQHTLLRKKASLGLWPEGSASLSGTSLLFYIRQWIKRLL